MRSEKNLSPTQEVPDEIFGGAQRMPSDTVSNQADEKIIVTIHEWRKAGSELASDPQVSAII